MNKTDYNNKFMVMFSCKKKLATGSPSNGMESEPHCREVMSSVRPSCDRRKDIYSYIVVHILPEQ